MQDSEPSSMHGVFHAHGISIPCVCSVFMSAGGMQICRYYNSPRATHNLMAVGRRGLANIFSWQGRTEEAWSLV